MFITTKNQEEEEWGDIKMGDDHIKCSLLEEINNKLGILIQQNEELLNIFKEQAGHEERQEENDKD